MASVKSVETLLNEGAKIFGKVAKNGNSCLVNEGENGIRLFTTIDKDFNILRQIRRVPIENGYETEIIKGLGIRDAIKQFVDKMTKEGNFDNIDLSELNAIHDSTKKILEQTSNIKEVSQKIKKSIAIC